MSIPLRFSFGLEDIPFIEDILPQTPLPMLHPNLQPDSPNSFTDVPDPHPFLHASSSRHPYPGTVLVSMPQPLPVVSSTAPSPWLTWSLPYPTCLLPLPHPLITMVVLTPLLGNLPLPPSIVVVMVLSMGATEEAVEVDAVMGLEAVVPPTTSSNSLQGSLNLLQLSSSASTPIVLATAQSGGGNDVTLYPNSAYRSFDAECEILRNIKHKNLVQIISSCSYLDFKALVGTYMQNGSLDKWLHASDHHLSFIQQLSIMIDVASAIEQLHHVMAIQF
ncbi:hypothetical protein Cgig2_021881 [Carnegiea gigantea]|uniref:Protein kinase domain-containing protein n=1 Tax=Carnegiea gigantea TaxID=171969 RepID=A0A9Q1GY21_9CARY|nr:hypothetical protein Cgig2_021881 [Carnegiea gigantea]